MVRGMRGIRLLGAFLVLICIGAGPALSHPHVIVTARSVLVFDAGGRILGVRHAWTFDEAYSAYAVTGMKAAPDGRIPREQLRDLAKLNVESLEEFAYFTALKQGKTAFEFGKPPDGYYLDHDGKSLILNFFLPLKKTIQPSRTLVFEVQDESLFVAFSFAEDDPVRLEGSAGDCRIEMKRPKKSINSSDMSKLSEDFFNNMKDGFADQFASRVHLVCP